jgi:flagellar motility protein MotE (MotC chaperone)
MTISARSNSTRRSDVRLIPAVAGVAAILLCLKAGGFAFGASAATTPAAPSAEKAAAPLPAVAAPAPATAPAPPAAPDPLEAINSALPMPASRPPPSAATAPQAVTGAPPGADVTGAGISQAEIDVLTSLAGRRGALDERQRELDLKAQVIAAAEKRVDEKISQLKALQTQIETLMGQRETREAQQLDGLVRVYSAMKPRDAARIFASLDGDVRINVAGRMRPDAMAGILAALPSDVAQRLTVELATRYRAPRVAAGVTAGPAPAAAPAAAPTP